MLCNQLHEIMRQSARKDTCRSHRAHIGGVAAKI